jgi:hypothetical protein
LPQTKPKRILPKTPSFSTSMINASTPFKQESLLSTTQIVLQPAEDQYEENTQENVTEWLKKSFDTKNDLINETKNLSMSNTQFRRNSATNAFIDEPIDEPIVEINLTRQFYLKKQILENGKSLKTDPYLQYSKSHNNLSSTNDSKLYRIDTNDDFKKVFIYKDPKELSLCSDISDENVTNERRPSLSLGMQIAVTKLFGESNKSREEFFDESGAIITSIEPDGIIDQFNVSINEGDELVEVCGVNLRNKNDHQIEKILDENCKKNNGEIELLVRRNSNSIKRRKNINNTDNKNEIFNRNGFNEISIKKNKEKQKNHETLIADPALLYAIRNKRFENLPRSHSPVVNRPKIKLDKLDDVTLNENINTNIQIFNQNFIKPNDFKTIQNSDIFKSPLSNSPVDLDGFRALSLKFQQKQVTNYIEESYFSSETKHTNLIRKTSNDSAFHDSTGISNSSSKEENSSLFSLNSSQKMSNVLGNNNLKLDERSIGYNSNQSTPTSEPKSNNSNKSLPKNSPYGSVMVISRNYSLSIYKYDI